MKVTPVNRKFGKYSPGEEFELKDALARVFIRQNKLAPVYQTRAMTAVVHEVDSAGVVWDSTLHTSTKLKNADGTWRKKPGSRAK